MHSTKRVAVITRTKNRPLLLDRARLSVTGQSLTDLVWIIVNDGGDRDHVEAIATAARSAGTEVQVVHHDVSRGMEAATNAGLAAAPSDYVTIHDDDDSWDRDFLRETVGFLDSAPGYGGVTTRFRKIQERMGQEEVEILRRLDAEGPRGAVHIADMVLSNPFPPIAFLYRRRVLDAIGPYREDFPVLGDWEFNLRFIREADIACLDACLANYHHRVGGATGANGNSVTDAGLAHLRQDAVFRNALLREDLAAGRPGIGVLLTLGHAHWNTRHQTAEAARRAAAGPVLRRIKEIAIAARDSLGRLLSR